MKLTITIDGKIYEVEVEAVETESAVSPQRGPAVGAAPPVRIPAAPLPTAAAPAGPVDDERVCRSPVSGVVVRLTAQLGQSLQIGDVLVVLEAMKMETNITAPITGKVAAIRVAPGEAVQAGQVVVEFE